MAMLPPAIYSVSKRTSRFNYPYSFFSRYFRINTIWYRRFHFVCDKLLLSIWTASCSEISLRHLSHYITGGLYCRPCRFCSLYTPQHSWGIRLFVYAHRLRLPFGLRCLWPAYPPGAPYIRFLSVRLRFRYPFFSPTPHSANLGSLYGVR